MRIANHLNVRILVFGAGAMGSLIGALLSSKHEVTLVARQKHVDAIRKRGVEVVGKTEMVAHVDAVTSAPATEQDLVIVSTKAYDTLTAIARLKRFWDSSTFLTLQNGLRNPDVIAERAKRVVAGTISHGVTFVREGVVRHAGLGDTYMGPFKGVSAVEVGRLCDEFTACGFPVTYSGNIRRDLWLKVIVNSSINPLTAIARVENGILLKLSQLNALMNMSSIEGATVARAEGIDVSDGEVIMTSEKVASRTAMNRSSMLQDVEKGRRTEVEEISGAIVEAARKRGIRVPVTETLASTVAGLESLG